MGLKARSWHEKSSSNGRGFNSKKMSIYGELDIYQQMESRIRERTAGGEGDSQFFKPGDHIVHKNHGIGIYIDTISRQISGIKREYFLIEYGKGDKLYIPTWQADRISKYIGSRNPSITSLDSKQWDNLKKKVRRSVQKLAVDLARLYAERQSITGYSFPKDSAWQSEIEQLFPFTETPDQIKAIEYVKKAMEGPRPMDVLVVGDVGFGKTEVAIRAAFKALEEGKQVLMLVPTTILADQHYNTFSARYRNYPVTVEVISRFRKKKKQSQIVDDFNLGKVDMLIGTHRVLQKDIIPHDLGLIIVDEEQRFGVNSKEKIKLIKKEVDVLTMSATPIPRTLYMSMAGVRDMALIETYPEGRNPIETFVGEMDPSITRNAIEREMARGGQVYYVYNRISGIEQRMHQLVRLIPLSRIIMAHGQMDGPKVEKIMNDFINKKYDILLTTSIIESGMDIENVNTLIVENSHMFGLSQLYQLRGRVGRSSEQAYAYFFYPNQRSLSTTAFQRLKTLSEYTDLGSGYNVAMKDLEIRGAGEILGPRQHGHINSVGYEMYCQIIKEETGKLKGLAAPEDLNIQIDLPVSAYIPRSYIKNQKTRVNIYRDLGMAESFEKIADIKKNLEEKYGTAPLVVLDLLGISKIKYLLRSAGIERLKYSKGRGIVIKSIVCDEEKFKKIKNKEILMDILNVGLILVTGVVAGFMNTLGGGGSLLTLPMLIFLGSPAAVANGTNRIALMVQNIVGVSNFRRKGFFYPKLGITLAIPAVLGSFLGARIAISIPEELFQRVLAVIMIIILVLILTRPEKKFFKKIEGENLSSTRLIISMFVFFGVGVYGGFIQAGVGFIIISALALITGMSLVKINSLKLFIVLIYISSSLVVFIIHGKVDWILGLTLAIGNALGAYLGSNFAVSKGDKWIRVFIVIAILSMSAKLLGLFNFLGL